MTPGGTPRSACRFISVLLHTAFTCVCAVSFEMPRRSARRSTDRSNDVVSSLSGEQRRALLQATGSIGLLGRKPEPNSLLGLRQVLQPLPGEHVREHPAVGVSDDATPCVLKRIRL